MTVPFNVSVTVDRSEFKSEDWTLVLQVVCFVHVFFNMLICMCTALERSSCLKNINHFPIMDSFLSGTDIQTTDWSLPSQMSSRCLASNRFLSRASCSFLSSASRSVLLCLLRTPRALMTSLLAKAAEVSGRSFAGWRNSAHALALALAALVACDKGRIFTMVCLVPRASRAAGRAEVRKESGAHEDLGLCLTKHLFTQVMCRGKKKNHKI